MIGLFSRSFNSQIRNLTLLNIYTLGKNKVGSIAGVEGHIINCHTVGEVRAIDGIVGGIAASFARIENCSFRGIVKGDNEQIGRLIGGLAGSDSWIKNSYSFANVIGVSYVGGLIGDSGSIQKSYSCSNVIGVDYVGGLFGKGGGAENCYSTGKVIGQNCVGGLGGINYGVVKNCYATSPTSGTKYVDGLIGIAIADYTARVEDSFFDINTTNQDDGHYGGRTTDEMMNPETFTNWDFENVWWMIPGKTYPLLRPVRYVGLNIKPEQSFGLPAEFKIIFDEPVRNFTFDDVDISLSTVGGILGTLTPDDAPTTITAMDCFTTWTLRLEDAASTTGLIVMRLPVAAAMNAANYPTTESVTLILPLIEPLFGDLNADGVINTLDRDILIALILDPKSLWHSRLLLPSAADINKDGVINVADIISLITYLK
ncbi:MAG TPA: dockerin type I repeat-containing protein [Candidatus Sumerlaeota bacterium]|nr:dockerin type I repeat-containing protein [Candidatus Sumerlaeota bacterium]HON49583.1 dockerin type I repeat-containing protein [Candidatus Sumerlaeota bacterium]HOR64735.1 dockerin type I repeat-containing protein [Candidatus Sumerlaeota bacterium]